MRTPQFLAQKTSDFSKFVVCPHEQVEGGLASADKGSQLFAILCGRLLWTAP